MEASHRWWQLPCVQKGSSAWPRAQQHAWDVLLPVALRGKFYTGSQVRAEVNRFLPKMDRANADPEQAAV